MRDISRRDCLKSGVIGAAVAVVGGCAPVAGRFVGKAESFALPKGPVDRTTRLINRVAFGPRPGDVAAVESMGPAAFVDRELQAKAPEDLGLLAQIGRLDVYQFESMDLRDLPEEEVLHQLQQAAILRAVYGRNQLQERMVEFWSDHFNVYARKGLAAYRKGSEEQLVIRTNALGKFPEMLRAMAHCPAMLAYLDNQKNVRGVANENYARELMELHALGVNGGYTQQDVHEVARCLTGWCIETRFLRPHGHFRFDPDLHDGGSKTVLGVTIPAGGDQSDGERVLDILSSHPSCARFISRKLCRQFLGYEDKAWEQRTAETYLRTKGDIPSMLKPLLLSQQLLDSPPMFKRPFDYLVSALRALDASTDAGRPLQEHLTSMGQPLYQWPMPDGFPHRSSAWTGGMLPRWNFAYALSNGDIRGTNVEWQRVLPDRSADRLVELTFGRHAASSDTALRSVVEPRLASSSEVPIAGALCLASPEFQWR